MNSQDRKQYKKERTLERLMRYHTRSDETIEKKFEEYFEQYGSTLWFGIYLSRYQEQKKDSHSGHNPQGR